MNEMYHLCRQHMNCRVRIHTCDGRCYEGVITNVDCNHVYLQTGEGRKSGKAYAQLFGFGILALSLFTLFALFLI
ncbi:MAG: hypothetical protein ACE3L7_23475 [Candidatus Pristimantibacillus sp.]